MSQNRYGVTRLIPCSAEQLHALSGCNRLRMLVFIHEVWVGVQNMIMVMGPGTGPRGAATWSDAILPGAGARDTKIPLGPHP